MRKEKEPMQGQDPRKALTVKERGRGREGSEESQAAKRKKKHRKIPAMKAF